MSLPIDPRVPQGSTYDRQAIIEAVTRLYTILTSMANNRPEDLQNPPPDGWPHITRELMMEQYGKTEEVYQLLKHLPYLKQDPANLTFDGNVYLISKWTELCDYSETGLLGLYKDHLNPKFFNLGNKTSPPWTVALTRQTEGKFGTYWVVDTTDGTITKMGFPSGYDEERERDYAENDPRAWRNMAQTAETIPEVTRPAVDFFNEVAARFRRLDSILVRSVLLGGIATYEGPPSADYWNQKAYQALKSIYLEHGWPDNFDRDACEGALPAWNEQVRRLFDQSK